MARRVRIICIALALAAGEQKGASSTSPVLTTETATAFRSVWADAMPRWRCARPTERRSGLRREDRSEEHTSELQSHSDLVCRLLLEKKNYRTLFLATIWRRGHFFFAPWRRDLFGQHHVTQCGTQSGS